MKNNILIRVPILVKEGSEPIRTWSFCRPKASQSLKDLLFLKGWNKEIHFLFEKQSYQKDEAYHQKWWGRKRKSEF
jgi:hypothetical protein